MSRTGRPLALDSARRSAIADALARGATIRSQAIVADVSERTIHCYLERGLIARPPEEVRASDIFETPRPEPEPLSLLELLDEIRGTTGGGS